MRLAVRTYTYTVTREVRLCDCGALLRDPDFDDCVACQVRAAARIPDQGLRARLPRRGAGRPRLADYTPDRRPSDHRDLLAKRCSPMPEIVDGRHQLRADQAAALCGPCPFRHDCLRTGLALQPVSGTYGGHNAPLKMR